MKKADLLLIGAVLLVAGAIAAFLWLGGQTGSEVVVEIDGVQADRLPLAADIEKEYTGADGGKNLLVIKDGKAWVKEADCPDKICAKHRPISRSGESIICLPHKLVITVVNEKETDGIDAKT